ncbi:MAG TPA: hypothetical protein VGC41_19240 [Kofleriaceae bacterium]
MNKSIVMALAATFLMAGCAAKPKSTTTTRTQTNVQDDSGQSTSTDVKQTTTEQKDGTQNVKRVETTNTSRPAN